MCYSIKKIEIIKNTKLHNNVKNIDSLINNRFNSRIFKNGLAVVNTKEFGEIAIFSDEYKILK